MSDKRDESARDQEPTDQASPQPESHPEPSAGPEAADTAPAGDEPDGTDPTNPADPSERPEEEATRAADGVGSDGGRRGGWPPSPGVRRAGGIALRILLAAAGAFLGILIGGHTTAEFGPVTAELSITPYGSTTQLSIPPVASVDFDLYDGPLGLNAEVVDIDGVQALELAKDNSKLGELEQGISGQIENAAVWLVVKTALFAIGGAAFVALLAFFRRWREPFVAAGVALVLLVGSAGLGWATYRPEELSEFTIKGAVAQAPSLVSGLATKFSSYGKSVSKMVANISKLYSTVAMLPGDPEDDSIRLLHVSDLHLNPEGFDLTQQLVDQFEPAAVLDTGDLVDWGSAPEDRTFADAIPKLGVPYVYVKGNHDSDQTVATVASLPNAIVLNDTSTTIEGIEIAGIGDTRFSPDKSKNDHDPKIVKAYGKQLAEYVDTLPEAPSIAMVHDPVAASALKGKAPIVLAGHTHARAIKYLGDDTTLMVEGSTGGAGLRGLEHPQPTPLTATVLYFNPKTKALRAYDEVTVGGLGEQNVTIERHTVEAGDHPDDKGDTSPAPVTESGPAPQIDVPDPAGVNDTGPDDGGSGDPTSDGGSPD